MTNDERKKPGEAAGRISRPGTLSIGRPGGGVHDGEVVRIVARTDGDRRVAAYIEMPLAEFAAALMGEGGVQCSIESRDQKASSYGHYITVSRLAELEACEADAKRWRECVNRGLFPMQSFGRWHVWGQSEYQTPEAAVDSQGSFH